MCVNLWEFVESLLPDSALAGSRTQSTTCLPQKLKLLLPFAGVGVVVWGGGGNSKIPNKTTSTVTSTPTLSYPKGLERWREGGWGAKGNRDGKEGDGRRE